MYSYTYDEETGGILLNSTPTLFSKEPRPVYADELDLLGFDKYWKYDKQSDIPYMWAESVQYIYRGKVVAKLKGGDIFHCPEIVLSIDDNGKTILPEPKGKKLKPINMEKMAEKNREIIEVIESATIKKIVKTYEKYVSRLDVFHVAFSGGKDSAVLLDLVRKALPKRSFAVIFGDTGMEFPDTYDVVYKTRVICEKEEIPFYISRSHFEPHDSWNMFGPPARVLRWCCSVHKSTPQTLKLREITGKKDYIGLDFVGVRRHESATRSKYTYENYGEKQKGQYSYNPILDWTSAEIWLYIFINNLPINAAYKKGNSRAGCLLCPMGGGRGDYIQLNSYPEEVSKYMNLIKSMNARNAGDEESLNSYVSNGGWNARKNGRDLTINQKRYLESKQHDRFVITVINPGSDWKQWIKTIGDIPFDFDYKETKNGYEISLNINVLKLYPKEIKKFKQVFHKAAHCVGCKVCETNCQFGCISFDNGLNIINCRHCGQCHDIDDGCLAYHSLRTSNGDGTMERKESINSFANHAPKLDWVRSYFELKDDFWDINSLNQKNQIPFLKRFLRECGLIDNESKGTALLELSDKFGWDSNIIWGIMVSNFAYNPQFKWYINNMEVDRFYDRDFVCDLLMAENVKKDDATSIITSFKKFCELPIGTVLNWGYVDEDGSKINSLCRTKCILNDNIVVLYSLLLFSEKIDNKEFNLSWIINNENDIAVSPTKLFGLNFEEMKSILLGLTSKYPDYINATFTNDLEKITIKDKSSIDVLDLLGEE